MKQNHKIRMNKMSRAGCNQPDEPLLGCRGSRARCRSRRRSPWPTSSAAPRSPSRQITCALTATAPTLLNSSSGPPPPATVGEAAREAAGADEPTVGLTTTWEPSFAALSNSRPNLFARMARASSSSGSSPQHADAKISPAAAALISSPHSLNIIEESTN